MKMAPVYLVKNMTDGALFGNKHTSSSEHQKKRIMFIMWQ